jgi:hypothetical protein
MSLGESLADQLQRAIRDCEVCVFLATRRSIESPWCLAELGAFWGAGKKVLLFMADPDLAETTLPPQFKGTLRADTGPRLIEELKRVHEEYHLAQTRMRRKTQDEFFPTSTEYGSEKDWATLLDDTHQQFDVLGVTLGAWRRSPRFRENVLAKAGAGCKVRAVFMHRDNELLKGLVGLVYDEKKISSVRRDIDESYAYYSDLASAHENISVRQIRVGIPHFMLTRSDKYAVVTQYLTSSSWAHGPTWKCVADSPLFNIVTDEFDHIWTNSTEAGQQNT